MAEIELENSEVKQKTDNITKHRGQISLDNIHVALTSNPMMENKLLSYTLL